MARRTAPARFKRVAEAFDEVARARLCESSGSEHSPENSMDLSDLVKSFIEKESEEDGDNDAGADDRENESKKRSDCESYCLDSETKETLFGLLVCQGDEVKRNIQAETEEAYRIVGIDSGSSSSSSPSFKRRLMIRLRDRGFDAGICKTKWERTGRIQSGSYEYIDVIVAGTRYIIEVSLAGEFEIARATNGYASLLGEFPPIFVGKAEELKEVVRVMCRAVKGSMKSVDMHAPPWRRFSYMQTKWFGPYRRTINEVPAKKGFASDGWSADEKRLVGFMPLSEVTYHCREVFARKVGLKGGQLSMVFNGTDVLAAVNTSPFHGK
ncbi:hypothetical protein U1Q18_010971 [Sarracenia purpurea var. burkii]